MGAYAPNEYMLLWLSRVKQNHCYCQKYYAWGGNVNSDVVLRKGKGDGILFSCFSVFMVVTSVYLADGG